MQPLDRRSFLKTALGACLAGGAGGLGACQSAARDPRSSAGPPWRLSLAQWSLHRSLRSGELDALEFAQTARALGLEGLEYVNQFFMDRAGDRRYLQEMKQRAEDAGVRSLLIMCDGEGALGAPEESGRARAVENHRKWLEAAAFLGCHSIRVNAASQGGFEEQRALAADGLRRLTERADELSLNVLVENHGGLSSNGAWLAGVMQRVDHPRCGTLPDFGNFRISESESYDRYRGVAELMPWAKAVSAKSYAFADGGRETTIDYSRMLRIVAAAGYGGYLGIEYEGEGLSELEGVRATRQLIERVGAELTAVGSGAGTTGRPTG